MAVWGKLVSESIVVQVPPPAGQRWKATEATSVPPGSEAEPVSVTVPRRLAPGSLSAAMGSVLSTVTARVSVAAVWFPTWSVTRTRRS